MYKLLIVEDEHLIRNWLNTALDYAEWGFEVIGLAQNGHEGAKMILELRPDLVFSDITMPVKDAFAMFEATQQIPYEKILISGYSDFNNAKKGFAYGVFDFIEKPIDLQELTALLTKVRLKLDKRELSDEIPPRTTIAGIDLGAAGPFSEATQQVIQWLHQHYASNETIAEIAKDLGYSESHLYTTFKEETTVTINQYRRHYRVQRAIDLIQDNPEVKIYELAEAVGIHDHHYFNQTFKRVTGYSINDFKTQLKTSSI